MEPKFKPPYLGAAYYPEDWPESEMEKDIRGMKDAGINVARMAEFAWSRLEPEPGRFDFAWLHRVVDALGAAGIATVLCTPTATPPIWLSRQYPDVLAELVNGRRRSHGGRRHCCSNNPHYREASARIVEAMAKEFAGDENVIGWQVDNEIYAWENGCFCPECRSRYISSLQKRFGSIQELNKAWNLTLWSQEYQSFEQIPAPRDTWVNPHHTFTWNVFQQESQISFVAMQAEILKKYVHVPVGTDTMPFNGMNYCHMYRALDVVQFNHYNSPENLWNACMWFDFLRGLKDRPFWNTETSTCYNAATEIAVNTPPEGFCYANSWLPLALGGEANMYWLWRTHWAGHELMHGAVLDTSGRPMYTYGEVQKTAADFAKAGDFLRDTKVRADLAIHFPSTSWNLFASQKLSSHLNYQDDVLAVYKGVTDSGLRPALLESEQPVEDYRLVISPFVPCLEEDGMGERMRRWVEEGGTWVVGPLTDNRGTDGVRFRDRALGSLEAFADVYQAYSLQDGPREFVCRTADGRTLDTSPWYDLYAPEGEVLASVEKAPHSSLSGKAVLLRRRVGKGTVIVVGFVPTAKTMREVILPLACESAGIAIPGGGETYMTIPRSGNGREGVIYLEYAGKGGSVQLAQPMYDCLHDRTVSGTVALAPYEVLVLEKRG